MFCCNVLLNYSFGINTNHKEEFVSDNSNVCVTSGGAYTDIDALACAIAYGELRGCDVILPGELNSTVPESVRKMSLGHFLKNAAREYSSYVIVDVSNPDYFPEFVNTDKIITVFDHHTGFEAHWGRKGKIEFVGACATLIWELFTAENKSPSTLTANLLYTAIFANTLNFNASISSKRDEAACNELQKYIDLPNDWIHKYYSEVEAVMLADLMYAFTSDMKVISNGWAIAQIELYDASEMIKNSEFLEVLSECTSKYKNWVLTMPSISEGKNYFVSNSEEIKNAFADSSLNVEWNDDVGTSKKLFLRKEILKILGMK